MMYYGIKALTCWNHHCTAGDIQYSTSHVELDFIVLFWIKLLRYCNLCFVISVLFKDCSVEDIRDELPDSQPRFIVYSYCYRHDDGRTSYPLCFIFVSPQGLLSFTYLLTVVKFGSSIVVWRKVSVSQAHRVVCYGLTTMANNDNLDVGSGVFTRATLC